MAPAKSPALTADALGSEFVTIHVGPKRKTFAFHKKPLCDRSDYFSKAFTGGFQESDGVLYLPEDDPEIFAFLTQYIYQGVIPSFPSDNYHCTNIGCVDDDYLLVLTSLFFLAEKFCMNELENLTMDAIQDSQRSKNRMISTQLLRIIYQKTHENSKLRLYAVLLRIREASSKPYKDGSRAEAEAHIVQLAVELPDFAKDFIALQIKYGWKVAINDGKDPRQRHGVAGIGQCFFHTHPGGETCQFETAPEGPEEEYLADDDKDDEDEKKKKPKKMASNAGQSGFRNRSF